jgi:hypothetical protein
MAAKLEQEGAELEAALIFLLHAGFNSIGKSHFKKCESTCKWHSTVVHYQEPERQFREKRLGFSVLVNP